jgi:hypothetical protein
MDRRVRCVGLLAVIVSSWVTFAGSHARQPKGKAKTPDPNMLSLEVTALRTLRTLQATPAQMKALLALHQKDFVKAIKREPAKVTAKYRKTLVALRDALVQDDDDEIKTLSEKLEILKDDDEEVFDAVETTPAASEPARDAMRLFTPSQILAFMKANEDDLADPADVLMDALDEGASASAEQWTELRDDAARQVAWMIAGLAPKAPGKVRGEVQKWLDAKHVLKPEDFKSKRSALQAEATKMFTNRVAPTTILTNFTWHSMAELLCNPRLPTALRARLKAATPPAK